MTVGLLSIASNPLTFPAALQGSPNVTITAINTGGGIVTSRDSDGSTYQTPFFIQVSASAITATGTSNPYEDLEYQWNFGDAAGAETFTRPTDGATVNANNAQTGPEATYVYMAAGTYTITLSIRGKNGAGYTTAVVTKSVTVAAFAPTNTYYFDATLGADGNAGTIGSPKQTMSALNALIASNTQFYLKRSETWTGSFVKFPQNFTDVVGVRIDAYGSGAIPKINNSTNSGEHTLTIDTGSSSSTTSKKDIVVSNVYFLNSASVERGALGQGVTGQSTPIYTVNNVYHYKNTFETTCDTHTGHPPVVSMSGASPDLSYDQSQGWGFWGCTVKNPTTSTTISIGLDGSSKYWFFVLGGTVIGAGSSNGILNVGDHHIYDDVKQHASYRWIDFGQTGSSGGGGFTWRNMCINGNWDRQPYTAGTSDVAQWIHYAENNFRYTQAGFDLGNRTNNADAAISTVFFDSVVVERNAFNGVVGSLFACGRNSVTQRDNRLWGGSAQLHGPADYAQVTGFEQRFHLIDRLYRNRVHVASGAPSTAVIVKAASGWTSPMTFTDNIIADFRSSGLGAFQMYFADQASAGSLIDRNTIYTPNNLSSMATDQTAGARTYAQYKALAGSPDVNGVNTSATVLAWPTTATQWSDLN